MPLTLRYNLQLHSAVTPSSQSSWKAPAWPLPSCRFDKACFSVCKLKASIWQTRTAQSCPPPRCAIARKAAAETVWFLSNAWYVGCVWERKLLRSLLPFPRPLLGSQAEGESLLERTQAGKLCSTCPFYQLEGDCGLPTITLSLDGLSERSRELRIFI